MDALAKAFQNADRMRLAAKASGSPSVSRMVSSGAGPAGVLSVPTTAREQMSHLRGWVWACVRLIATRIAGQPIHVGKRPTGPRRGKAIGDGLEPLETHALLSLLDDPSDLFTAWSLKFVTVASLEVTGRSLWWVTTANGRQTILHIPTHWIRSVDSRRTVWTIRPDGATEDFPLPGDEVVCFQYPDPTDPLGCISPLSLIAEAVLADEAIGTAQWAAFRNGIHPKIILTAGKLPDMNGVPGERPSLTPEQRQDLIAAIRGVYSGAHRAGEPFIVDGLIERIDQLSTGITEMDFLDSSKLTKSRILQAYGVSPILLGEVEGANRASATVADEIFVANKINPLIQLLSESMTEWLGPMFSSKRQKLCVWIEPAVAHDPELTLKQWELASKMGFVSGNEFRRILLNLPDADGLDELQVPAGMLPRA